MSVQTPVVSLASAGHVRRRYPRDTAPFLAVSEAVCWSRSARSLSSAWSAWYGGA